VYSFDFAEFESKPIIINRRVVLVVGFAYMLNPAVK
jgi:hypothetical protein